MNNIEISSGAIVRVDGTVEDLGDLIYDPIDRLVRNIFDLIGTCQVRVTEQGKHIVIVPATSDKKNKMATQAVAYLNMPIRHVYGDMAILEMVKQ